MTTDETKGGFEGFFEQAMPLMAYQEAIEKIGEPATQCVARIAYHACDAELGDKDTLIAELQETIADWAKADAEAKAEIERLKQRVAELEAYIKATLPPLRDAEREDALELREQTEPPA